MAQRAEGGGTREERADRGRRKGREQPHISSKELSKEGCGRL